MAAASSIKPAESTTHMDSTFRVKSTNTLATSNPIVNGSLAISLVS
jgi:hypothetical protein